MKLPHLKTAPLVCPATPHTPKGVVVRQAKCLTCHTSASPGWGK
jgi:hypothetical protein